ncbi:MAG: hypothetical protein U1F21_03495 [Sphaerotilus natans]
MEVAHRVRLEAEGRELLDVAAGDEGAALAAHDHAAQVRLAGVQAVEDVAQLATSRH